MSSPGGLVIEPLERNHNRTAFDCGIESLDRYLKRQAGQDIRRRVSRVFVGRSQADDRKVLGFYTLSALAIDLSALPVALTAKLPRHPVPAALIGRLAVDRSVQDTEIGRMLLADAIKRTLAVSEEIAIYAMVVDAIDEHAESFYQRYGFARLAHDGSRLFLPLKSL